MVRHTPEGVTYAPLYIHSFQLLLPHHQAESEKFNGIDPNKLTFTADKLRYFRYKKALIQREVADYERLDRSTYISLNCILSKAFVNSLLLFLRPLTTE